jgi:hypothetical protein
MSLLHDHLNARNLQAFQIALDASLGTSPSVSSSIGATAKSWKRGLIPSQKNLLSDVNARDWLGRTALHLACTSVECLDYVRALLNQPHIDVNLPDAESLWTPLHRALYSANISAACVLSLFFNSIIQLSFFQSPFATAPRHKHFAERFGGIHSVRSVQFDSQWDQAWYRRCRTVYMGSQSVTT